MALRDDLYAWLSEQPLWQQDLATRLIDRPQLDGAEYDEALRATLAAFDLVEAGESATEPKPLRLDDLPTGATQGAPRLLRFGRLRGVGAASSEHELRFSEEGLTVIYGANAVGKTTYVRGLKRVCRAVDRDSAVRGNVFAPNPQDSRPTAKVEFSHLGQKHARQLDLESPPDLGLQAISVFDAECAEMYVDAKNAIAFVPIHLRLLARLASTQDRMRRDITARADELKRRAPGFPELVADTVAKRFAESLRTQTSLDEAQAAVKLDEARALTTLDETEQARAHELRGIVAAADARNAQADAEAARQDARSAEALAAQLRELGNRISIEAQDRLQALASRATSADAAVELANREFSDLPIEGVGGGPWRQLWRAAREFAQQTGRDFPPTTRAPCPLCLQEISPDAASRLSHFEQHVQSTVQEEARLAREELRSGLATLDESLVADCHSPFSSGLRERDPDLHLAIERYLEGAGACMEELRSSPSAPSALDSLSNPAQQLEEWGRRRATRAETLLETADPETLRGFREELAELDARQQLSTRLPDIEEWLTALVRLGHMRNAYSALATNRISRKQSQLSEEVVTEALEEQLRSELEHLQCRHLPVDLTPQTRVGETQVGLQLAGAHGTPKVSDIASEGEQRALSLAFFLAEVLMSDGDGGIVVDDPVSSLDDERREYIAKRLVAEAAHRQVIVFTHDLPFMLDLLDLADTVGVEPLVQGVWRLGAEVGRVDEHPPFKTMKLGQRISVLEHELGQWDKQDAPRNFDEAWRRVCDFYARLRITWERAIEERLFRGVVTRFQREVKTLALDDVVVTPEAVAMIRGGMSRCSTFVHDEPPSSSTRLPDRSQLAHDLSQLREFARLMKSPPSPAQAGTTQQTIPVVTPSVTPTPAPTTTANT